jgi:hypothetical protein
MLIPHSLVPPRVVAATRAVPKPPVQVGAVSLEAEAHPPEAKRLDAQPPSESEGAQGSTGPGASVPPRGLDAWALDQEARAIEGTDSLCVEMQPPPPPAASAPAPADEGGAVQSAAFEAALGQAGPEAALQQAGPVAASPDESDCVLEVASADDGTFEVELIEAASELNELRVVAKAAQETAVEESVTTLAAEHTAKQLREMARAKGLAMTGTKSQLAERVVRAAL